tara:strand:- start:66 stop:1580 length:1515 start_codon:yes stop_codon:yes gene_type:complete
MSNGLRRLRNLRSGVSVPQSGLDLFLGEASKYISPEYQAGLRAEQRADAELELARNEQVRAEEQFQANKQIAMNQEKREQEQFNTLQKKSKSDEYSTEFNIFSEGGVTQESLDAQESYIESIIQDSPDDAMRLRKIHDYQKSIYNKEINEINEIGNRLVANGILPSWSGTDAEINLVKSKKPELLSQYVLAGMSGDIELSMQPQASEDRKVITEILDVALSFPNEETIKSYLENNLGPAYEGYVNKYNASIAPIKGILDRYGITIETQEDDLLADIDKVDLGEDIDKDIDESTGEDFFATDASSVLNPSLMPQNLTLGLDRFLESKPQKDFLSADAPKKLRKPKQASKEVTKALRKIQRLIKPSAVGSELLSGMSSLDAATPKSRMKRVEVENKNLKNFLREAVDLKTGDFKNEAYKEAFYDSIPDSRTRNIIQNYIKNLFIQDVDEDIESTTGESLKDIQQFFSEDLSLDNNRPPDAPVDLPDYLFERATTDSLGNPVNPANR